MTYDIDDKKSLQDTAANPCAVCSNRLSSSLHLNLRNLNVDRFNGKPNIVVEDGLDEVALS